MVRRRHHRSSDLLPPLLKVSGDVAGGGQRWSAWHSSCRGGTADVCGVRVQAHLLVVEQLADDNAAEVLVVFVAVVQQLADFGGARRLVDHQLVVLAHQHGASQQRVQALVETGLRHLGDDLHAPHGDPAADGAL